MDSQKSHSGASTPRWVCINTAYCDGFSQHCDRTCMMPSTNVTSYLHDVLPQDFSVPITGTSTPSGTTRSRPLTSLSNASILPKEITSSIAEPKHSAHHAKPTKQRPRLPRSTVKILQQWCQAHADNPYPTEEQKEVLMAETGLTISQLSNWFANARRRGKINPKKTNDSLPDVSVSSSIPIPPAIKTDKWHTMTPLDRWRHSPPEHDAAPLSAIARAVERNESRLSLSSNSSAAWSTNEFASLPRNLSFQPSPSVTSDAYTSGQSDSSATSAHSSQSAFSHGSIDRFYISERPRRRRRKLGTLTHRLLKGDTEKRIYQCTFCTDTFKSKYDWTRHEKSLHLSLESWTCAPFGPREPSPTEGTTQCAFCGSIDPTDSHLESHRYDECKVKPTAARTFYRKDHLRQHLRLAHGVEQFSPSMLKWNSQVTEINSRCGFCGERFVLWLQRNDHLAAHFLEGTHMKQWKGCRGFDPAVALLVQNAMPPYLIGHESTVLVPFSATKLGTTFTSEASAVQGQPTPFEFLTERLGQFVKVARGTGITLTDQLLQQQARIIIYGDDDPWNQTAADNPDWLDLFKRGHGLDSATYGNGNELQLLGSPADPMLPGMADFGDLWATLNGMQPPAICTMGEAVGFADLSNSSCKDCPGTLNAFNWSIPWQWQSPEALVELKQQGLINTFEKFSAPGKIQDAGFPTMCADEMREGPVEIVALNEDCLIDPSECSFPMEELGYLDSSDGIADSWLRALDDTNSASI